MAADKLVQREWPPEIGRDGVGGLKHWVQFCSYGFKAPTKKRTDIALFIPPDALSTGYKAEYKNLEMSNSQVAMARKASAQGGIGSTGDLLKTLSAGWDASTQEGKYGAALSDWATGFAEMTLGENYAELLKRAQGKSVNPNIIASYQGPNSMRDHKFTFQMMPKSETESQTIQQIVKDFKRAMLPSAQNANSPTAPIGMFNYPDEFEITFFVNGKPQRGPDNSLFRIARSVLTDISLNYTTQDTVAFFEGTTDPVTIELGLEFQEIHMMHRGMVEAGY